MKATLNYLFVELGIQNTAVLVGIFKIIWDMKINYKAHMADCQGKFNVMGTEITGIKEDVTEVKDRIHVVEKKHSNLVLEIAEKFGGKSGSTEKRNKKNSKKNKTEENHDSIN